jgi:SpoVK/Ycf46/Vps4 family AAA+-type ATPase
MTELDSCKHVVCDNFFYVNHHDIIEISPKIFMQVTKIEKNKNSLSQINFELFSYDYTLTELQDYINKVVKVSRIKKQNKLGNQLYYFNEIVEALPTVNGKIMYSRALPNISFNMTPFFTNKTLYNMYGESFQVVRKRVDFFINNEDWYRKKGIPYTLGILIHGPPGSGKTSAIKAIANSTKRHIVNITLNENTTKTQLQNLFYNNDLIINKTNANVIETINIPCDKRVYVIEDIDCLTDVVLDREFKVEKKEKITIKNGKQFEEMAESSLKEDSDEKLNLSFLLNLFDGVLETPGRILIMSSNYPERIDKALIRPGRIDLNICFGYCNKETIKQIINFFYEIPINQLEDYDFADNVYTPAQVNQLLFNNIDNKQKGIESLLKCNYSSPIVSPVDTPREKIIPTVIDEKLEDIPSKETDETINEEMKEEVPKGTTSLDDMFFDERIINFDDKPQYKVEEGYEMADDEEVIRVLTKQKKAFEKGLGDKIYNALGQTEAMLLNIDAALSNNKIRMEYSIDRIKMIEKELDEQIEEYGIVIDNNEAMSIIEVVKEEINLDEVLSKLNVAFINKDFDTVKSLQKYVPKEGYNSWRIAYSDDVINFLNKKRKALQNGLATALKYNEYKEDAVYFDIQNRLNDKIGLEMYGINEFEDMKKELEDQINKYNIQV